MCVSSVSQTASKTLCAPSRYPAVASLLEEASIPVLAIPGDQDYTLCPNPETSLQNWIEAFVDAESDFGDAKLYRDESNPEAFVLLKSGVIFFGLDVVQFLKTTKENEDLMENMLIFYFGMLNYFKGSFRAIVVMGNSQPTAQHDQFFSNVVSESADKPLMYIHANAGSEGVRQYNPFEANPEVTVVEAGKGGENAPTKITVGFGGKPFVVG